MLGVGLGGVCVVGEEGGRVHKLVELEGGEGGTEGGREGEVRLSRNRNGEA